MVPRGEKAEIKLAEVSFVCAERPVNHPSIPPHRKAVHLVTAHGNVCFLVPYTDLILLHQREAYESTCS